MAITAIGEETSKLVAVGNMCRHRDLASKEPHFIPSVSSRLSSHSSLSAEARNSVYVSDKACAALVHCSRTEGFARDGRDRGRRGRVCWYRNLRLCYLLYNRTAFVAYSLLFLTDITLQLYS